MIECSKDELVRKDFVMLRGLICDALDSADVYGWFEILPDERAFLTMKICGDVYFPHRARDSSGKDYGEIELSSGALGDLEKVEDLIAVLSGKSV